MDAEQTRSCPAEEQLEAYVNGACTPDERAGIESHLAGCERCRQYIADSQANNELFQSVRRALRNSGSGAILRNPLTGQIAIEGYDILDEIGRGGMGVVYRALQTSTRRVVALKVMLDGPLASQTARRRFEREIELAAGLSHPNIIAIHDSGLSHDRYYFAMDYVAGQRLDHYVRDRDLPLPRRLGLMQKICNAIHYAHQHGVIHRDLKPSNILVDAAGEPHILDFGLAKTVTSTPGESLLISISGEVLGTLPYMAPEQARGDAHDVDCRTDVYALGVIFYEMLTGRYPYPVAGQMADVLRHIAESEPARPSTVYRTIKDDLETIVLKTLSKEKDSRYESAGALAADIARYVAGEAIEAKRNSGWYVLRKTLRRYKWPAGIAAAFVLLAVGASIVTFSLYHKARTAGERARSEQQRAEQSASALAEELATRTIQAGRDLAAAGDLAQAEGLLWREFLRNPDDPLSLWAMRELYAQQPCLGKVQASTAPVATLTFDPSGQTLITADLQGILKIWDMPACRHKATMITQGPDITSIAASPDGKHLATISSNGAVRLLDLRTGRALYRWDTGTTPPARHSGGKIGATASQVAASHADAVPSTESADPAQTQVFTLHAATSRVSAESRADSDGLVGINARPAYRVAFSPDGRLLAGCAGQDILVWDVTSRATLHRLTGHSGEVTAVAFSPDGRTIASGSKDRSIILWDVRSGQPGKPLRSHLDTVSCVAFGPDGDLLASASWDGSAILWSVATGECLASLDGFGCWVHSVAFAPDGGTLATGDIQGRIRLWNLATGVCVTSIPAHVEDMRETLRPAVALAFRPQGDVLASAAADDTVKLWDLAPSREMLHLAGNATPVVSVDFDPAGRTLIARTAEGATHSYDLTDPTVLRSADRPATQPADGWDDPQFIRPVSSAVASPNGRWLAERTSQGVQLREVTSQYQSPPLPGLDGQIHSMAFSPDNRTLATADARAIRLWQVPSGRPIATLIGDGRLAWGLTFSPSGRLLACAGNAGVRIWNLGRYDRCLLGNYAYHLEQARQSEDFASRIDEGRIDRWARSLASAGEQPLWMARPATASKFSPSCQVIADWGRLTRHRLLFTLRDTGYDTRERDASIAGAIDPPPAALTFFAGSNLVRQHTITPSGLSPQRVQAAEYQRQRQSTSPTLAPAANQAAASQPTRRTAPAG